MRFNKIKRKFKRNVKVIPKLRFGVLHSRVGFKDGVSIVMRQLEEVIINELGAKKENIFYLVGKSKEQDDRITVNEIFDFDQPMNKIMQTNFEIGFTEKQKEDIEEEIMRGQEIIKQFIDENKIDVIIAHNLSHPVNFIMAMSLSRYYSSEIKKGNSTPKYLLWWHDSHAERIQFSNPASDVKKYLREGIPGGNVEYIAFINTNQFSNVEEYFLSIDMTKRGFYDKIKANHDVIYNTTDIVLNKFKDLFSEEVEEKKNIFLEEFNIENLLGLLGSDVENNIFVLQHTRMVRRKRIDFALEFAFELLAYARKQRTNYKSLYFLISGNDTDGSKEKILDKYNELRRKFNEDKIIIDFVDDHEKTSLSFSDYPLIFNNLGGLATYFSEVEGFGNNLLELFASGFTPIIYQYPVYKSDIAKFHFKVLSCNEFKINDRLLAESLELLVSYDIRSKNGGRNIKLIKNYFSNSSIAEKLKKAILSKRTHWRKKSDK